jgi:NAD(P)H-nitrite reductase large subunit
LAKAGVKVTLFSNESVAPYFRPRLIAVAFGQTPASAIAIKPVSAYEQAGIEVKYETVKRLNLVSKTVNGVAYDGVIVAQGARPFVPKFQGEGANRVRTLWTMDDALTLQQMAQSGTTLVVIGGGVLGLEAALRATMAGVKVTVLEVAPALLGGVLGAQAEAVLRETLLAKGIEVKIGVSIAEVTHEAVRLSDGTCLMADTVLCSAGARPNVALAEDAGAMVMEGVRTNPDLSLCAGVYAAGDLAYPTKQRPPCAVMRAMKMGSLASNNLLAELSGASGQAWKEPRLPLFMKVEDVEFHVVGDTRASDLTEERVDDGANPRIWKSVLRRGDTIVGLRWVGTRAGFGDWERRLEPLA